NGIRTHGAFGTTADCSKVKWPCQIAIRNVPLVKLALSYFQIGSFGSTTTIDPQFQILVLRADAKGAPRSTSACAAPVARSSTAILDRKAQRPTIIAPHCRRRANVYRWRSNASPSQHRGRQGTDNRRRTFSSREVPFRA